MSGYYARWIIILATDHMLVSRLFLIVFFFSTKLLCCFAGQDPIRLLRGRGVIFSKTLIVRLVVLNPISATQSLLVLLTSRNYHISTTPVCCFAGQDPIGLLTGKGIIASKVIIVLLAAAVVAAASWGIIKVDRGVVDQGLVTYTQAEASANLCVFDFWRIL